VADGRRSSSKPAPPVLAPAPWWAVGQAAPFKGKVGEAFPKRLATELARAQGRVGGHGDLAFEAQTLVS
jgi:hypothetical protein